LNRELNPDPLEVDRAWFDANPDKDEYIRELIPNEFPPCMSAPPAGYRIMVRVLVLGRYNGAAICRTRLPFLVETQVPAGMSVQ
jgi:hypothetical protein